MVQTQQFATPTIKMNSVNYDSKKNHGQLLWWMKSLEISSSISLNVVENIEKLGWIELQRTSYEDTSHLKKCCVSPVWKEVTVVSKRLGKMYMVVEKLRTFQESCGLMMQSHYCNPHDPRMGGEHRDV
ncbi:uncharacterized protein LOC122963642 isoform X2 [Acropora millepora]|uniref:uncharacterized protein LOC122963642 isoform X2 n=1 Tax=Acropora millepora TaxID=45264 RepID=UPI001CF12F3E|nr:uncharacterized protein LOC122963642 isoform X2 [Acropora millepora]